jgi:hypothetical protein
MSPVFSRSAGVFNAYRTATKIMVDKMAYSTSLDAVKVIRNREMKRKIWLSNRTFKRCGIWTALPENKPW